MVDRGHLINSLRWEMFHLGNTYGVFVGSFGIKYAAMNEFGGVVTEQQRRAMMAAISKRSIRIASKGIIKKHGGAWSVITSYSIHYTKLYDLFLKMSCST